MRIRLASNVSPTATLVACLSTLLLLVGCADKAEVDGLSGTSASKNENASTAAAPDQDVAEEDDEDSQPVGRDKLQEQLQALYDRKTVITDALAASQQGNLGAKTADVRANVAKRSNSTVASGIDTVASGATVGFSIASGNWFGAIIGGVGLIKSGQKLKNDAAIAKEANAVKAEAAQVIKLTTAQEAALKKELTAVDSKIVKLEKKLEKESKTDDE